MYKILGVIPSRLKSTRLPEKPLRKILNKPMIQWVYEGAYKSKLLSDLIIATDSETIISIATTFGAKTLLTSKSCRSGTDRVAEVARMLTDYEIIVNIQGDEPMVNEVIIDALIEPFSDKKVNMTSLMTIIKPEEESDPAVVKVVCKKNMDALYFSRHSIPFDRDGIGVTRYKHLGFYAYKRDFLLIISNLSPTPLERAESLEQLRVLENGFSIRMNLIPFSTKSVDTIEDLIEVERILKEKIEKF
ncbi:3-deoxy-manno-octulosonate cytidylyltransferase (CMP-KDO synthetase) [Thermodesulfobium acidiphilum]|uniref:3-deoxy-manno-octulosonate cytidylyltransferase n=1 Tax=Thermodesulfobium acidiphilum TaxID=1794699 RepID=A0A2R4W1W4_THEAF|nr:3-deoxy-manno-octulosonate cytidylyltransferase [Thermodesulfobium acidiphilum]AWB10710.1 3-deoxy-manno-octulosonate cytidylyltransferase (CMP-KDO synthetase) [Thermodesulfobium acidiphilum]